MTLLGRFLGDKISSKQDLINIVLSQELFMTLSHQRDWDGQIMSVRSTIGTVASLLLAGNAMKNLGSNLLVCLVK